MFLLVSKIIDNKKVASGNEPLRKHCIAVF